MRTEVIFALGVCVAIFASRKRNRLPEDASKIQILRRLLSVMFPRTREFFLLAILITVVSAKTKIFLNSASVRRGLAKFLVCGDSGNFAAALVDVVLWSIPRAIVDCSAKFAATLLAQRLRLRLQETVHESLECSSGYIVCNSVDGFDQRCTSDAMMVSYGLVDIILQLVGPMLDIIFLSHGVLEVANSRSAIIGIASYFVLSLVALRGVPETTELLNSLQGREADLRTTHGQISAHAEEIAFYRGESIERENSNRRVDSVLRKSRELLLKKPAGGIVESLVAKYLSTAAGYLVCAEPVLGISDAASRAGTFGFLQQLYTPLTEAAGRVARVNNRSTAMLSSASRMKCVPDLRTGQVQRPERPLVRESSRMVVNDISINVKGTVALKRISFSLVPGDSLLITGSSGVGKSTLVSVIAGVELPACGSLTIPRGVVFVSPQRTVLPLCPLRDLLTYPIDQAERLRLDMCDTEIVSAAVKFGLSDVLHNYSLDVTRQWDELLSGGERQRVGLTRVALHRPTFAILDDCTNALTQQDEIAFLTTLQHEGVTLLTVSHRAALRSIHNTFLNLDDHVAC